MFLSPCDDSLSCCARSSSPAIWLQDFPEALLRRVVQPWTTTRTTRQRTALAALANCLFITGFISLTFFFLPRIGPTVSTLLLSATPLLMRVEPLRQDPVPVVAQGEPDEREHVKVEPGDEYLLYERGRLPLLGLCGGGWFADAAWLGEECFCGAVICVGNFQRLPVQDLSACLGNGRNLL